VPKDSPIQDIRELDGKSVAFPAPNALGASLLMRAELETVHGVKVKPLYVQTHSSVYLNVILNKAAAGGGVLSTLKGQKKEIQDRLRVFYQTRAMAPHPLTAHPRVPREHREAVRQALLEMTASEEGRTLLKKIPMLEAIAANPKDYRVLKDWGLERFYEGQ
jgi:phosphonate transport system substrate-binding protein